MTTREERGAIVLAGGASSRFGSDKLAQPLDGRPLLDHALAAVDEVAATIVLVLAPGASCPALPRIGARVVIANDREVHQGPLAGLSGGLAALGQAAPHVDQAVLVGGDMPSLVPDVLAAMLDALAADPALGAVTLEADPVSALPMALRPSLAAPAADSVLAEGRRALRAVLDGVPCAAVPAAAWRTLDPGGMTLRDVDWPADLTSR